MTIEEAKQRITLMAEVQEMIYEQAWQNAKLPENMRDTLHDYIFNDFKHPDMDAILTKQQND